ncbi:MAG: two-component system NarL family sensor kinase [Flavobacteriales bacterium]|jgi:two-component system NarL family sensor kinase
MNKELIFVIYGGIVLFLILSLAIIFFVVAYRRSQRAHITEKKLLKSEFQTELLETQLEISEQTMKQIAQEIHDNIGQRMTLAIQMNQQEKHSDELQPILKEVLNDLRDLSQSLHGHKIHDMGLDLALERECALISKAMGIPCEYQPPVERIIISDHVEIILFRCAQEILNNAMKHANTKRIKVQLNASTDLLSLTIKDFGKGFDASQGNGGLGFTSLRNRVGMILGEIDIQSSIGKGTSISISLAQNVAS